MVEQDKPTTFSQQTKRVVQTSAFKARFIDDGTYTYAGLAKPGIAVSSSYWQIKRVNNATGDVDWAGGDIKFIYAWDDYASLSYS